MAFLKLGTVPKIWARVRGKVRVRGSNYLLFSHKTSKLFLEFAKRQARSAYFVFGGKQMDSMQKNFEET